MSEIPSTNNTQQQEVVGGGEPDEAHMREAVGRMSSWYEYHKDDEGTPDDIWKTMASGLASYLGFTGDLDRPDGTTFSSLTPDQMMLIQGLYRDIIDGKAPNNS